MGHPDSLPALPAPIGWDADFTRLARDVQGRVGALVRDLTGRFQKAGLDCDVQVRQTTRGLTTFLALVGQRGLLCVVDITLVDGMAVAREPGVALDIRLLDACGDAAARCSACWTDDASAYQATSDGILATSQVGPRATAIYLLVMGVFGLPSPVSRGSERAVG